MCCQCVARLAEHFSSERIKDNVHSVAVGHGVDLVAEGRGTAGEDVIPRDVKLSVEQFHLGLVSACNKYLGAEMTCQHNRCLSDRAGSRVDEDTLPFLQPGNSDQAVVDSAPDKGYRSRVCKVHILGYHMAAQAVDHGVVCE
jgi:hypothetical protein